MDKLISTYSFVKPPTGSNIDGGEMLDVLLNTFNDFITYILYRQKKKENRSEL